ncbi:hypothetical protein V500_02766 [Pseudogymnoascus sp. VKM F-4518 (FW-2643)]|nr:hypothetical protein V500_02766 [Pseudogymnoascus sp. VKM F-4518 (FW-2643)]
MGLRLLLMPWPRSYPTARITLETCNNPKLWRALVKRFSALTPTVPPSVDGTPPERQILPLTPPATSEWQQLTSDPQSPGPEKIRERQTQIGIRSFGGDFIRTTYADNNPRRKRDKMISSSS